jgi:hypothetical protein
MVDNPNPVDKAMQTMLANLPEKTGKSLAEWQAYLSKQTFTKFSDAVKHLKEVHGITHGFANTIVHLSQNAGSDDDDLLAAQFAGKEEVKAWYEAVHKHISAFGTDVDFSIKKAYVSLRRKKQFGLLQPSTKARLDVGINLKDVAPAGKLEKSGSFSSMCTHRWRVESASDVSPELISHLKAAYDQAG